MPFILKSKIFSTIIFLLFATNIFCAQAAAQNDSDLTGSEKQIEPADKSSFSILHPKKKIYAILGDLVPLAMVGALGYYTYTLPYDTENDSDRREMFMAKGMFPVSFILLSLGTLPSHFYSKSPTWSKITFPTIKLLIGAFINIGMVLMPADTSGNYDPNKRDLGSESLEVYFKYIFPSFSAIQITEMIIQWRSINKYNKSLEKSVYLLPSVIDKNKVGLAVYAKF
ncbi:MAG: hypothetical protein PHE84_04680 [bacterium]|nr:hypothetical protein [bacterium]